MDSEYLDGEYNQYWETQKFLHSEELDRWGWDETISGAYYGSSSSPDGAVSNSIAAKNIVSERNRRKKLNERLFALRSVVPNISKMDKASIIKDAIEYIQVLHEQEKSIRAELANLEEDKLDNPDSNMELENAILSKPKKKRIDQVRAPTTSYSSITIVELRVSYVGERTLYISLTCDKKTDTMIKLCEVFESLKLKIITANIISLSGKLVKTVFIEADEEEKDQVKFKIENAIATLSVPQSPMSI